jgi:U3 small nucleolar RNA-associated protein 13
VDNHELPEVRTSVGDCFYLALFSTMNKDLIVTHATRPDAASQPTIFSCHAFMHPFWSRLQNCFKAQRANMSDSEDSASSASSQNSASGSKESTSSQSDEYSDELGEDFETTSIEGDVENSGNNNNDDVDETEERPLNAPSIENDEGIRSQNHSAPPRLPTLSKLWTRQSGHSPMYTGGPFLPSSPHNSEPSFLLTPVHGDLAIVCGGQSLGTIRKGETTTEREEEEEDGMMDRNAITAFALSSNNRIVLTCSHNNLIREYSISVKYVDETNDDEDYVPPAATSLPQLKVEPVQDAWGKSGHTLPVNVMRLHCSDVFLATGSVDGSVRIWDVRGRFVTHVFRPTALENTGGLQAVTALEWMPQAQQLVVAIGRDDGSITIHNLRSSAAIMARQPEDRGSKNARRKTSHREPQHHPHDPAPSAVVLRDHVSAVTALGWDASASFLVSAGRDAVLNLWKVLPCHVDARMTPSALEKDEEMLYGSGSSSKRKKRKIAPEQENFTVGDVVYRRVHTLPIYEQVEGIAILSKLGTTLVATAGSKGQVRLWKINEPPPSHDGVPRPIYTPESGQPSPWKIEQIASQPLPSSFGEARGGYTSIQKFRNVASGQPHDELIVADAEHNLSFLRLQDKGSSSLQQTRLDALHLMLDRMIVGHNDEILDLKVIPPSLGTDEKPERIVVATNSSQVRIFDLERFSCQTLERHTATVLCVDVSPCGRFLATCGKDKQMCVWTLEGSANVARCAAVGTGHTEAIGSVALSRKAGRYNVAGKAARNGGGSFAVTVSIDRTLKRWNLPGSADLEEANQEITLEAFISCKAHEKDINIVVVAPNDALIATGSQDKTVKLWKSTDLSLVATLKGHRRGVWDCSFSSYDRVLATSSGDKSVKLWSLGDYSCVRTFQGHLSSVLRVRFLGGGLQLVSSGADGLIKVWTIRTNECECTMDSHADKVWALDLSADGTRLVSGSADSTLVVWRDATQEADAAKQADAESAILLDQKLANHVRRKEYGAALDLALLREKPHQTLKVLNAIIEGDVETGGNGYTAVSQHVTKWSMERVAQVMAYCRDWNTRARNSSVALLVIRAIVSSCPVQKLAATEGISEIVAGIIPYSERHFERIDRLYASSFLLDFVLSSMGSLDSDDSNRKFRDWETSSRLVLPSSAVDGRVQIGGKSIVGAHPTKQSAPTPDVSDSDISIVGDSDSSEDDGATEE